MTLTGALLLTLGAHAAPSDMAVINKAEETLAWTLTAPMYCPKVDKDGRWLDGVCVQLVTKTAAGLLRSFVPDSRDMLNAFLEVVRCERGPKSAGGTQPFLAPCVERKAQAAARSLPKWKELRVKSPDLPGGVPDAPLPKGDSLFQQR
ncbi:MAG: hypothetical protein HY553_16265 [Elusimicrobia bacterium]|nr:hypothetical protein [Elusimicrobiota bacterium]